jgi:hypothetical protein
MKSSLWLLLLCVVLPAGLRAQSFQADPDFRGHLIGETVADFLRIEPEAQQETNVCRQRTERRRCLELIAAVDRGQRTEVSTTSGGNFVLDAGQLVKLTVLVTDSFESAADSVSARFNAAPRKSSLPVHDASGNTWQNVLYTWDTPHVYATLYQDNNPVLQDRRPLLIVESRAEHILDDAFSAAKPTSVASTTTPKRP